MKQKKLKGYRLTTIFAMLSIVTLFLAFSFSVVFLLLTILIYLKEKQINELGERIIQKRNAIEKTAP